jgi:hypothetical protein
MNSTYQKEFDSLTQKLNNAKKQTNVTNQAVANGKVDKNPQDDTVKNNNTIAGEKQKIDKFIEQQTQYDVNKRALFFKPSFLVNQFTPYLSIYVRLFNEDGFPYYINLFEQENGIAKHNHLKNLTINLAGEAASQTVEFSIVDVYLEIYELLLLKIQALWSSNGEGTTSNITMIIKYGWSVDPSIQSEYKNKVMFTNIIAASLSNYEVAIEESGLPNVTFNCTIDNETLAPPLSSFLPYLSCGFNPALSLTLLTTLKYINDIWDSTTVLKEEDVLNFARVLFYSYRFHDRNTVKSIISKIASLYPMQRAFWNDVAIDNIIKKVTDTKIKDVKIKPSPMTGFDYASILNNMKNHQAIITTAQDSKNKTILYSILSSLDPMGALKAYVTNPSNQSSLSELVLLLSGVLKDIYIHPYIVWEYVYTKYSETIVNFNIDVAKTDFQKITTDLIEFYDITAIEPKGFLERKSDTEIVVNYDKFFNASDVNKEIYGKKVKDFQVTMTMTWDELFRQIENSIYLMMNVANQEQANTLKAKNEKLQITGTAGNFLVPMASTCLLQSVPASVAIENMNFYVLLTQGKLDQAKNDKVADVKELNKQLKTFQTLKAKYETIKRTTNQNVTLYIRYPSGGDILTGGLGSIVGRSGIVQAYSIRMFKGKESDWNTYNPGYPTVWDINFPDVLNFTVKSPNLKTAISGLIQNSVTAPQNQLSATTQVKNTIAELRNSTEKAIDAINIDDKQNRASKIQNAETFLAQLKAAMEQDEQKYAFVNNQINVDVDFQQRGVYSGTEGETLTLKKNMQAIRRELTQHMSAIEADLRILGDPTFNSTNLSRSMIFIKVLNPDGSLSMYTGLYLILSIKHEISQGKFETIFSLMLEPQETSKLYKDNYNKWATNDSMIIKN